MESQTPSDTGQPGTIPSTNSMARLKRQRVSEDGDDHVTLADSIEQYSNTEGHTAKGSCSSLIVKSLPGSVHSEDLVSHFSQSHPIKHATVVYDKTTRLSKGFGFVTFSDLNDTIAAKQEFDNTKLHGGRISVDFARPRQRAQDAQLESPKLRNVEPPEDLSRQDPRKIIVRNMPWSVKCEAQLESLFKEFGEIKYVNMPNIHIGRSPGFGFVLFRRHQHAKKALEGMNGKQIAGRQLAVDWAVDKAVWLDLQGRHVQADPISINAVQNSLATPEHNNSLQHAVDDVNGDGKGASATSENAATGPGPQSTMPRSSEEHFAATVFVRNVPFTATDDSLGRHFMSFGPLKFARVVKDPIVGHSKGTAFVRFQFEADADDCLRSAATCLSSSHARLVERDSILQDQRIDPTGRFTMDDRVLLVSRAVDKDEAARIASVNARSHSLSEGDRRRLFLLAEGKITPDNSLHHELSDMEVKLREDSTKQRRSLVSKDPSLCLSLTRLSVRNLPRALTSRDLGALARKAAVGFATDVKSGFREPLSKEERNRDGRNMKLAEDRRRAKGKGIVKQAKIIFEDREGSKVAEGSQSGRSRGYGFIEYTSHRWALMGLRWLNGRSIGSDASSPTTEAKNRRLIVEFAIENSQVVARREQRETKDRRIHTAEMRDTNRKRQRVYDAASQKAWSESSKPQPSQVETSCGRKSIGEGECQASGTQEVKDRLRVVGRKRMARRKRKS